MVAASAEKQPPNKADAKGLAPGDAVDDELLKDLGGDPLDHLDRKPPSGQQGRAGEQPGPGQKPAAKPEREPAGKTEPTEKPGEGLQRRLTKELGPAAAAEEENPLLEIARRMRDAQGRIGQTDAGPKTVELQADIVARLNDLLRKACKSAKQCSSSAPNQPSIASRKPVDQPPSKPGESGSKPGTKPATTADTKPREGAPAKRPDQLKEVQDLVKQLWGELPERDRQQMREPSVEGFVPKYETMIEDYFRGLAGEKKE